MFELQVVSNTPMTGVDDIDVLAETFLTQIGYLSKGYDPRSNGALTIRGSIPYRIFMDFFMKNPSKAWAAEEIAVLLGTTKPTVYRYINKLKSMDLLESTDIQSEDGSVRRGYRIRYGDIAKAWSFCEANVQMAMENYKKTVERFQQLAKERAEKS
ncbi:transcriptional regulator [Methanomethylophilus alvi]|uniref:transcriptional regulator n=1 Tax=Methanomethylophilus alvi TaxID=1291540 RepID=UPI0037DDC529